MEWDKDCHIWKYKYLAKLFWRTLISYSIQGSVSANVIIPQLNCNEELSLKNFKYHLRRAQDAKGCW